MESLIHLIYASAATGDPTAPELRDILADARRRNERAGLTGMLLYAAGSFFQVLEGPPADVDTVFARISADPRHAGVVTIIRERIAARAFGEWSMGYVTDTPRVPAVAGDNDFFGAGACFDALAAGRAKKLLSAFRVGRWRVGVAR